MTNKLKYFIGNWKMFGEFASIKIIAKIHKFLTKFKKNNKRNKIIVCVPNTLINYFVNNLKSNHIDIGAQNCHHKNFNGPFTGSVSASMIKSAGAKYIILGHSENRADGDTNQSIKEKIESAQKNGLNVIFCIGETLKQKRNNKTISVLNNQIFKSISKKNNFKKIIIAYEPIWSIGTGKVPKEHDLEKIFDLVKKNFKKKFKTKYNPVVLYGGSINDKNIENFSSIGNIDGFLIGGASQSLKKFIDIIKNYYK